jgi:hypothetical protein
MRDRWITEGTSLKEYENLFTEMGYEITSKSNADLAVFVLDGQFSHVASRSPFGLNIWESKLGRFYIN